jgi:carboxymethylenebutenolidase
MAGSMIDFQANGRRVPGYLALPPGGRGPGLIILQEWWGLVDHIKDVTDRFASEGFVALAPDLYHGQTPKSPDEAGRKLMAMNIAEAGRDMSAAAAHLLEIGQVTSRKVGIMGFCMGGQLALYALQEYPERIAAAVDFYGIHPNVSLEPARIRGAVLAHFGRTDTSVREADARALVGRFEAAGVPVEAHFYDAGHAFFNDSRPRVFDRAAATLALQRTLAFLRSHLA